MNQKQSTDKLSSDSMQIIENQTVGSTPTEVGQSSPDVAPDGSVVDAESEHEEYNSESWWKRLLPW